MIKHSSFVPTRFLANPHLQTLWPRFFRPSYEHDFLSERIELDDGDFLDLAWTEKPEETHKPLIIIFHGLEGSIHSPYAQGIMKTIHKHNWLGVLMHFRGCSGEHNRLDRGYHSGETGDIAFMIETMRQRYPDSALFALGYSLGGNALLKYLAEENNSTPLTAAMAVSVPFRLDLGADRLNKGFSKLYQWHLIRSLQKRLYDKFRNRKAPFDIHKLNSYNTFWLFDHFVTAPMHGFKNAVEYYQLSSSRQYLKDIKTNTLIIHAKDDPFVPRHAIPEEGELSDPVTLELSEYGGHVGFVMGNNPFQAEYWLEKRIPEFIHDQLSESP